jgi:protoporphyrinogen oxidase
MSRVVVLGGGWSGLLASIQLKSLFPMSDIVCIDRDFNGGLLRTEIVDNYQFDTGGSHVVFSIRHDVIKGILSMGGEWIARERAAYVLLNGIFVPYPFENGIYVLPPEMRARYGVSLINALAEYHNERPRNFREWILRTFGHDVANDYLIPYNEKIWKRPLDQLSADWVYVPGRLPLPSIEDIIKAVAGMPTTGYKEQALFYYPRKGGIIRQWEAAYRQAESLGVRFVKEVVREVKVTSGEYVVNNRIKADRVVSTLPLKEAPSIFDLPEEAFKAADRLDYNSVVVVGLGLKRPAPNQHWIYVPDKHIVFHRYAWISNYGEDISPNRSVLIAEITLPPKQLVDLERIKEEVLQGLVSIEVLHEEEVEVSEAWFSRYGYPIYTLTHANDVATIMKNLLEIGIITFGRWRNWQYWNTDKIYEKAMEIKL